MPRLLQRPRPRPSGAAEFSAAQVAAAELPEYEPLQYPLSETSKRQLRELASSRDTRRLGQNIEKAMRNLQESVGHVNDRAAERRIEVAKRVAAAEKRGIAPDPSQQSAVEDRAAQTQATALAQSQETEAALRELIDLRAELQDEEKVFAAALEKLASEVPAPQPRRRQPREAPDSGGEEMDVDDPEEEEPEQNAAPVIPMGRLLDDAREEQRRAYTLLTAHQRYGLDNDYIQFKRTWHDAQYPEDDVPMPDAARWFDQAGQPVLQSGDGAGAGDDEEDDIVVEREVRSYKCPLSLQWIDEPYSSNKCPHTFDKTSILGYLKSIRGVAVCPVAGCNQQLHASDMFFDEVFARKSKRARLALQAEGESEADEDADASMTVTKETQLRLKKERSTPRRGRMSREETDDEEEE